MNTREEVWLRAFVAQINNVDSISFSQRTVDQCIVAADCCLAEFDKRFPQTANKQTSKQDEIEQPVRRQAMPGGIYHVDSPIKFDDIANSDFFERLLRARKRALVNGVTTLDAEKISEEVAARRAGRE